MIDSVRLNSIFVDGLLDPLLNRLRRRLENGQSLTGILTFTELTEAQRDAISALLGRSPAVTGGRSISISMSELEGSLRDAGVAPSLEAAVEHLTGPVLNKVAAREVLSTAWDDAYASAPPILIKHPALVGWLNELRATGLLKRLARSSPATASQLLNDLGRLLQVLPAKGRPLPEFAASLLGDAHALDSDTPLSNLALRAASRLTATKFESDAEGRRLLWASVGILCDELSTPVLILNLPTQQDTPLTRLLQSARIDGEPLPVTLRLLLRYPVSLDPALVKQTVFVCENPTITALAAQRLGRLSAPLVCVNGQFATPAKILLRQLTEAGARLYYHGDFDAGGLAIARRVINDYQALPWRMRADDYLAAPKGKAIASAKSLLSPWDPALAIAIHAKRQAVHEEALAEVLLQDLALPSAPLC